LNEPNKKGTAMTAAIPPKSRGLYSALARAVSFDATWKAVFLVFFCIVPGGCRFLRNRPDPSIEFTKVPPADKGGPDVVDVIEGRVTGARPGQQIVLFAKSGVWWVQPDTNKPFTQIQPDSTFQSSTYLGTQYAAALVEPGYRPQLTSETLPQKGGDVVAIVSVPGDPSRLAFHKTVNFGGYEWIVRAAPSNRGGFNNYDPANAWTDPSGALHLRIARQSGNWTCAEVRLTRSLGYGSYRFVVRDTSQLEPAVVFGIFTWDGAQASQNHREVDIEVSRYGEPGNKNTRYVVQPYYVPANVERFMSPPGVLTHSFRWAPGQVMFRTDRGSESDGPVNDLSQPVWQHTFTSGVPSPGAECLHLVLYDSRSTKFPLQNEAEVVIEKFQFLP
jgi:hypothetical protein